METETFKLVILNSSPEQGEEPLNETKRDLGCMKALSLSLSRDPRFLLILKHFLPEGWIDRGLEGAVAALA